MMYYGYIYSLTLFDGRTYVGQTTYEPYVYFDKTYYRGKGKGRTKLCNAINKYGIDSFDFDIIDYAFNQKELNDKECYYIFAYDCLKNGLNLRDGGDGYGKHTEEAKERMSKAHIGKKLSKEQRKKMSESHKGKIISKEQRKKMSEINKGRTHSEETKNKMSKSRKGMKCAEETKRKISEANSGEKNGMYGKTFVCSEETKGKISEANSGEKNGMYGKTQDLKTKLKRAKPVISSDGSLFFISVRDAKKNGFELAHKVAKGQQSQTKGMVFRFATKEEISSHIGAI